MLQSVSRAVYRLPPELVSHIARFVPDEEDVDALSIIPPTHVCRFWRDSIISTPELWALIYSERVKLANLSLERAKAVPLSIHLSLDGLKANRGTLDIFLPHVIKTVSFTCINFSMAEELTRLLNFPKSMPNLRSLSLTRHPSHSQPIDSFDFSTHTTLRELSLYNFPLVPSILSLRTLTKFTLFDREIQLHVDVLLSFLEKNRSLKSASLTIRFIEPSLCRSHRQTPVGSGLEHLSISSDDVTNIRALISNITIRRGGSLDIFQSGNSAKFTGILSGVSTDHLPNLSSPIFMKYEPFPRKIRLVGPNGTFSYVGPVTIEGPFREFPLFQLANIRELRLECRGSWVLKKFRLSTFPSLEVLAVDGSSKVSLLSTVLPDPATPPSLKTLALLDCVITEDFMAQLTQIVLDRENTSISLHRVILINSEGEFPSAASVERLRGCVPVVEVIEGKVFPQDLS